MPFTKDKIEKSCEKINVATYGLFNKLLTQWLKYSRSFIWRIAITISSQRLFEFTGKGVRIDVRTVHSSEILPCSTRQAASLCLLSFFLQLLESCHKLCILLFHVNKLFRQFVLAFFSNSEFANKAFIVSSELQKDKI